MHARHGNAQARAAARDAAGDLTAVCDQDFLNIKLPNQ